MACFSASVMRYGLLPKKKVPKAPRNLAGHAL
jgi:hypothetical protein